MSDLVDNILHASGRESAPVRPAPLDLARLLADTTDALAPMAEAKGVSLGTHIEGPLETSVDAAALRRIIVNLADNAIKYGPTGQSVTVTLRNRGDLLDIVVDDEGPGIPRRERARVWERFSRLEHEGRAVTGTGIGLAVVRDLAERHGGGVRLDDAPGGGARVVVTLATGAPVAEHGADRGVESGPEPHLAETVGGEPVA